MADSGWWRSAFRFAVLQAGLAPAQFWQLTLPELLMLIAAEGAAAGLPDRTAFETLMQAFPDTAREEAHAACRR